MTAESAVSPVEGLTESMLRLPGIYRVLHPSDTRLHLLRMVGAGRCRHYVYSR
jgi:hypothetical protein